MSAAPSTPTAYSGLGKIRAVGQRDDLDPRGGLADSGSYASRSSATACSPPTTSYAAPSEVLKRLYVALRDPALQLQAAAVDRVAADLLQHHRPDAVPAQIRDDHEMRMSMVVEPGVDEAAGSGSAVEACDEVDKRLARW